jgi:hypothetical protein
MASSLLRGLFQELGNVVLDTRETERNEETDMFL